VPRTFAFVQVDVFTDRLFGGNQLAVFFDLEPGVLSDPEMQAIALEMNLAETTFVYPPTRSDSVARVRIFTPSRELPFAGHPTVGTSWVLANRGRLPAGQRDVVLEEGIGPVPVRIEGDLSAPTMVWMSHRPAEFGEPLANRAAFATALHLDEADLLPDQPLRTGSTGISFLFIPLRTPEAVDRAEPDMRAISSAFTGERVGVFVFAPDPDRGVARVYSRMFAGDTIGVAEDSAIGGQWPAGRLCRRTRHRRSCALRTNRDDQPARQQDGSPESYPPARAIKGWPGYTDRGRRRGGSRVRGRADATVVTHT
jgi:trans-2,3-dihydro-3-hydroxyanthranilate isomerase